jgi:hypothetical protein
MEARPVPVWNDQVPRLEAFKAAHPDVEIKTPLDTRSVWWRAYRDGVQLASEHDLRRLLDALDSKLDPEGPDL